MISLIIPVHNEEKILKENASRLISYLESLETPFEIVFIENGSIDSTPRLLEELSRNDEHRKSYSIPDKDLGTALRAGIRYASGEYIIWYPIDISVNLSYIPGSLDKIERYDLVVGSKEHPLSKVTRNPRRKALSFFYNSIVNLLFGLGISDTQCVKTFRAESVKPVSEKSMSKGIMWEVELIYRAKKAGLRMTEYPVEVHDTRKGSKIKVFDMLKAFWNLVVLRFKI